LYRADQLSMGLCRWVDRHNIEWSFARLELEAQILRERNREPKPECLDERVQ
jgi:hypothetical protein